MTGRLAGRLLLSVAEWCELTGEKPATVQARLRRGTLRGKKVGDRWRIYASELRKHEGG